MNVSELSAQGTTGGGSCQAAADSSAQLSGLLPEGNRPSASTADVLRAAKSQTRTLACEPQDQALPGSTLPGGQKGRLRPGRSHSGLFGKPVMTGAPNHY